MPNLSLANSTCACILLTLQLAWLDVLALGKQRAITTRVAGHRVLTTPLVYVNVTQQRNGWTR